MRPTWLKLAKMKVPLQNKLNQSVADRAWQAYDDKSGKISFLNRVLAISSPFHMPSEVRFPAESDLEDCL